MDNDRDGEKIAEAEEWIPPRIRVYERFRQGGFSGLLVGSAPDETGQEYRPPSVEMFMKNNHHLLTLAGVFAAVVVYFLQLTDDPDIPIFLGMFGGAVMFSITIIIILKNAFIAFLRTLRGAVVHAALYLIIIAALIYISAAMIWYFGRYPAIASHISVHMWGLFVIPFFIWGSFKMEKRGAILPTPPVQLGPITEFIYYMSGPIAILLMLPVVLLILGSSFEAQFISIWTAVPGTEVLITFIIFALLTIAVALFAIITQLTVDIASKLWNSK